MSASRLRPVAVGVLAVTAALSFVGCTGGATSPAPPGGSATGGGITEPSAVAPKAASGLLDQTTITVCYFGSAALEELQKAAPAFTEYTKGKVNVEFVTIPTAQVLPGTLALLKQGGACDVVDENPMYSTAIRPYLQPLTNYVENPDLLNPGVYDMGDFPKAALDLLSGTDGTLYGLPITTDAALVMYRKDLFDQWGLTMPALPNALNWDQFYDVAKKVKAKLAETGPKGMRPLALMANTQNGGPAFSGMAMWSAGSELFDGRTPLFDKAEAKKGFDYWTGLGPSGIDVTTADVTSNDFNEVLTSFQQGNAAIAIEWPSAANTLEDPAESPKTAGKIGYSLLPYATTPDQPRMFASVHSLALTKDTDAAEAAFEFAAWFSSKEVGLDYAKRGGINSGRASVMNDPAIVAIRPEFPATIEAAKLYHPNPDQLSYFDFMNQVIGPNTNAVFAGTMNAETALAKMQSDAEAYIKKGA